MEIDPKFIDVDFEREMRERGLIAGDLGRKEEGQYFASLPTYEDTAPLIPREDWEAEAAKMEADKSGAEWLVTRIYNQSNEGSCVANACAQAHEIIQALQYGKDRVVHLSAISLYKRIGSSPNSGAMVSDGLDEGAERGILPLNTPENIARFQHCMANTGFRQGYPSGWETTAKMFRFVEWSVIKTKEGMGTALLRRQPIVVGREGHSICYCGMRFKSGKLYVPYPNSWSEDWGQAFGDMPGGFGMDSERQFEKSSGWAFTPRAIVVPDFMLAT